MQRPRVQVVSDLKFVIPDDTDVSHYRRFNNSLVHFRGNIYLMTYRLFLPSKISRVFKTDSRNRHPWSSDWSSVIDETIVAVMEIGADNRFSVVRELALTYPNRLRRFSGNLQDARIANFGGQFFLYGQAFVTPYSEMVPEIVRQDPKADVQNCISKDSGDRCALVAVLLEKVHIAVDRNGYPNAIEVSEVKLPCLRHPVTYNARGGDVTEKNWCFFERGRDTFFEYLLQPHIVVDIHCRQKYESASPISNIVKDIGCGIFFSPGGPLAAWDKHHMIGCGHVKYRYKCTTLLSTRGQYMHPQGWGGFVYGMFFYLIRNDPPFNLVTFSHAFLPRHNQTRYTIVFPMACIPIDKRRESWAVSYGNGDDTPEIMIVSRSNIQEMLDNMPRSGSEFTVTWMNTDLIE